MKFHPLYLVLGVALGVVAFLLLRMKGPEPPSVIALQPGDAQVVQQGAQIYQAHCAACHGAQLQGQPNWQERDGNGLLPAPPHDASGHTWHHPDEVLFRIMKEGVGKVANIKDYRTAMPVYEGVLSDADIVAVLSWIKAQWPPELRERHDQINAQHRRTRTGGQRAEGEGMQATAPAGEGALASAER
jgi:S-disulfanyl-L-cysteine oxidoreductase SoxD